MVGRILCRGKWSAWDDGQLQMEMTYLILPAMVCAIQPHLINIGLFYILGID
jgi:hypothetical protein